MHNHRAHAKLILAATALLLVLAAFGVPVLPYLPLLAIVVICPLMMVLMMRAMDHGGADARPNCDDSDEADPGSTRTELR